MRKPAVKLSQKGWVVIPAEIRRQHKMKAGDRFRFVDYGGQITLIREPDDPVETGFGLLKRLGGEKGGSLTDFIVREHAEEVRRDKKRH